MFLIKNIFLEFIIPKEAESQSSLYIFLRLEQGFSFEKSVLEGHTTSKAPAFHFHNLCIVFS